MYWRIIFVHLIFAAPEVSTSCAPGLRYCGSELLSAGFSSADYSTLYECLRSGSQARGIHRCQANCIAAGRSYCEATCAIGCHYCGYELMRNPAWVESLGSTLTFWGLYECTSKNQVKYLKTCAGVCTERNPHSYCNQFCATNYHYCGHELNSKEGWANYHNNSLYICRTTTTADFVKTCRGECVKSSCLEKCSHGRLYCYNELTQLEGWQPTNSPENKALWRCDGGTRTALAQVCKGTCRKHTTSYCSQDCHIGQLYCGHEMQQLEGWTGGDSNSLYRCVTSNSSELARKCRGIKSCVSADPNSYCQEERRSGVCGLDRTVRLTPLIQGGQDAERSRWPWMVSLRHQDGDHICGGVLINAQWVLTAAHCVDDIMVSSVILANYLRDAIDEGELKVAVEKVVLYPRYNGRRMASGDIALVKLRQEVELTDRISAVCLPERPLNSNHSNRLGQTGEWSGC